MGNAKNSHRDVARVGRASADANQQPHGVTHTPEPWHAKQAAAQAAKHNRQMSALNRANDRKKD